MTGAVTAFCGPLGFVGIIGPHIAKALLGTSSHKAVLPASLLTGGLIGVCADLISRMTPSPMPVASTMALLGIPVILYIMLKRPEI
jgi:iron complex transport system permease protein